MEHRHEEHKPEDYTYSSEFEAEDIELEEALENIWEIAQEYHLDPFPTKFEVVPAQIMNELGSYGMPGRYSHWTHGRAYRQMKTMYDHGMSKVYELVINANPSQAYLLENNPPIENKFVMAHVLGHTDFFKNNLTFANTRRDMPEVVARNAALVDAYEERYGLQPVEEFLDAALSIEEHIDPYNIDRPPRNEELRAWREQAEQAALPQKEVHDQFEDLFPPRASEETRRNMGRVALNIPPAPDKDILGFIRNHAPYLEEWQRDILDVVRGESLYFYPQRRTKIMNEGWASYWHKRIMREVGDRELISEGDNEAWWKVHSGVLAPSERQLNPYYLGMTMYEYLEDYYNGNLSEEENDWLRKEGIPVHPRFEGKLKDSPAIEALRDIMIHNDDQSFIRNHFNKIVADRMNMFVYEEVTDPYWGDVFQIVKETGWKDIRDTLVAQMDNSGLPYIEVVDGDYGHSKELYLRHKFDGQTLDPKYIEKTLPYLYKLWQRPVHLETFDEDLEETLVYTYDGNRVTSIVPSEEDESPYGVSYFF